MRQTSGCIPWRSRLLLITLIATAPAAGCASPSVSEVSVPQAGFRESVLTVDTLERTFAVYVPPGVNATPGAVLLLHGGSGGSGERIRRFIGDELEQLADSNGFLVVYPDGIGGSWNDCRIGASYPAKLNRVDDTGFMGALIDHLVQAFGVDRQRVFAMGYSNGGHLAYRMALEMPGAIAGIAAFAANLPAADAHEYTEAGLALSVLVINGTSDQINPFDGGEVVLPDGTRLGTVRSTEETVGYFVSLAGYGDPPLRDTIAAADGGQSGTAVERMEWSTPARAKVALYTVHGGGHNVPSPRAVYPEFLGNVERRVSAVSEAVHFFGLRD